jgi:hypothetical protein
MADRSNGPQPSGTDQIRALYEQAESTTSRAFEELVSKPSFGAVMARSAENVAAMTRMAGDAADMVWRNLRVAGRADVTRLMRQLHRTEDKLERVLQEVELLREELAAREQAPEKPSAAQPAAASRSTAAKRPSQRSRARRENGDEPGSKRSSSSEK